MYIIGDVHGKFDQLAQKLSTHDAPTLCVGDFSAKSHGCPHVNGYKFASVRGNHEYYNDLHPSILPYYGWWFGMAYIGGASSIDKAYKTAGVDWFPEEEMSYREMGECGDWFLRNKPEIVVTHEAPLEIKRSLVASRFGIQAALEIKDSTSNFLQYLFDKHQPKLWVHGHHHVDYERKLDGTQFVGLGELSVLKVDDDGNFERF